MKTSGHKKYLSVGSVVSDPGRLGLLSALTWLQCTVELFWVFMFNVNALAQARPRQPRMCPHLARRLQPVLSPAWAMF